MLIFRGARSLKLTAKALKIARSLKLTAKALKIRARPISGENSVSFGEGMA